ncbi:hypothetical protein B0J12DRAFT_745909 [Macrophomina phaseolina]|uniref:Uncharacterized protein n=1 Tax=Macrophomina phaseolina TaxID=35725 RepID=A0ABQ8FU24_9PEZI|nr:hypothetical protein B0J12DRAFT_745909 [Macrophomina phaseolina]
MKLFVLVTLALGGLSAALSCENQADPQAGIANYCYCDDGNCYAVGGPPNHTCNPPGPKLSKCP